jgi:two-component system chemotaxis response regulator CheY
VTKTILAVDDSASMRQMVGFTLRNAGYQVVSAEDGEDALARLRGPIHMVITDLNMPKMDGLELIRCVRANPAYKYIPLLMLTTEAQEEKKLAGKQAGATGWIVKPFSAVQLLAVVKKVLG